jgi:plasmid maintenance system antidote protein VapI
MLLNFKSFSQKDTTHLDSIVCIKKSIAKKIALDLVKLDEVVAVNSVLNSNIDILKKEVLNRDSVIVLKGKQFDLSNQQYINLMLKYDIVNKQLSDERKKLKWSKTKTTISQLALLGLLIKIAIKN